MTSWESASNNSSCCRNNVWYSPRIASSESQYKSRGKREFTVGALVDLASSVLADCIGRLIPLPLLILDASSNDFESVGILRLEMALDAAGNAMGPFGIGED